MRERERNRGRERQREREGERGKRRERGRKKEPNAYLLTLERVQLLLMYLLFLSSDPLPASPNTHITHTQAARATWPEGTERGGRVREEEEEREREREGEGGKEKKREVQAAHISNLQRGGGGA